MREDKLRRFLGCPDCWLVLLLACATFLLAKADIKDQLAKGVVPFFYQSYYEPAVRVACGQKFGVDATGKLSPQMRDFLQLKRDSLDCMSVPEPQTLNPNPPTRIWYHLFVTVATVWKIAGVSWTAVEALASGLFALAAVAVYVMFRLAMAGPIALLLAFVSVLPAQQFLLQLRDLNKAPFILAAIGVAGWIVVREPSRNRLLVAMMLTGVLVGVGYGFRPDVLIGLPLVAIAATVFRNVPTWPRVRDGIVGSLLMLVIFALTAAPVFQAWTGNVGSCQWHFALLGLSDAHTGILGLTQGNHSFLSHYDDLLLWRTVESFAQRTGVAADVGYCTPAYDAAARSLYLQTLLNFPADFMQRALASFEQIFRYGVIGLKGLYPGTPLDDFLTRFPLALKGTVAVAWVMLVFLALARSLRVGLFILTMLTLLCAYPVVQFDTRHFFHLAFIAWLPFGIGSTVILKRFWPARGRRVAGVNANWDRERTPRAWLCGAAVLTLAFGALILIRFVAYWQQDWRSTQLFARYLGAGRASTAAPKEEPLGARRDLAIPADLFHRSKVDGRMLRVDLDRRECESGEYVVETEIGGPDPAYKFPKSHKIELTDRSRHATLFVPVYFERDRLSHIMLSTVKTPIKQASHAHGQPLDVAPCAVTMQWLETRDLPALWVTATVYASAASVGPGSAERFPSDGHPRLAWRKLLPNIEN